MSPLHLQIAEAGKRRQLDGDLDGALDRFRTALRLAAQRSAQPVFLHHYAECILDCLEDAGADASALEMTERALAELSVEGPTGALAHAALAERRIALLFKLGRVAEADLALGDAPANPVVKALTDARRRRLRITPTWIDGVRKRFGRRSLDARALREGDAAAGEHVFRKERSHA